MVLQADAPVADPATPAVEATPPAASVEVAEPVAQVTTPSAAEAAPAAAPVATTPAPAESPVAAVPPTPAIPPEIQQRLTNLEEQLRVSQQQTETRVLAEAVEAHALRLQEQYALAPEHAQAIAKQQGDLVYQQYQAEQFRQGQIKAAFDIAKRYGVDAQILINLPTPQAMEQAATQATASSKTEAELTRLRTENEALKKGRVPAQTFANGQGAANQVANNANIDALYMQWERANPNPERANPYEAQYRKFLYSS